VLNIKKAVKKIRRNYQDDSIFENQPLYLILVYLSGVISFIVPMFTAFKIKIPFLFDRLLDVSKNLHSPIESLFFPYIIQFWLIFGLCFWVLGTIFIVPLCTFIFDKR
jgi:uncharacterized membrane protein